MNMDILTREFTVAEIVDFIKHYFGNERYATSIIDFSKIDIYDLPEINMELLETAMELEEFACDLPELNFISLAA